MGPDDHLTPERIKQRTDEMRKLSRNKEKKLNEMAQNAWERMRTRLKPLGKDTGPIGPTPHPTQTPLPPVSSQFEISECETMRLPALRLPMPKTPTNPSIPSVQQISPVRRTPWYYTDRTADPEELLHRAISKFAKDFGGALPTPLYTAEWCFIWLQIREKLLFCSDERGVFMHELGDVLIAMDPAAEPYQVTAPVPSAVHYN